MENGPLGDDQLIFSGNIFDWSMITGGSVWVVRGTVGIHGATHAGMNSKQNQLEIFWVFSPRFFRSSKILNRNAGNAERFIRNVDWIFGHKLCVLDLFFLGLLAFMYCVREVFCVLITHYKDSISEWGQAFPYIFNIEIAFCTCGSLVSRRCPSQWMSYGAGHEKELQQDNTFMSNESICDWIPSKLKEGASIMRIWSENSSLSPTEWILLSMNLAVMQAADEGREVSFFFFRLFRSWSWGTQATRSPFRFSGWIWFTFKIDSLKLTAKPLKIDALDVESCIPWIVGEQHLFMHCSFQGWLYNPRFITTGLWKWKK